MGTVGGSSLGSVRAKVRRLTKFNGKTLDLFLRMVHYGFGGYDDLLGENRQARRDRTDRW